MSQDIIDGLLHGGDLFGIFIRNLAFEFFFQSHHQFHGVQRISTQIVDERRFILDFGFIDTQLFCNDLFNALFYRHLYSPTLKLRFKKLPHCIKVVQFSKQLVSMKIADSFQPVRIAIVRSPFKIRPMTVIAIFNQKGGVGKTTTVLNLASALVQRGRRPFGIDLDPQAQLSSISGITAHSSDDSIYSLFHRNRPLRELIRESSNGIRVIPSHTELSKVDALYGKGYNIINKLNTSLHGEKIEEGDSTWVIDCSPLVGVLSLNAIFACDGVIVPISADYLSMNGAMQIRKTLHALEQVLKHRVNRRYLLTRFDSRRNMGKDIMNLAVKEFGDDVCKTIISENVSLAESPSLKKTIFEHAPNSRGAQDYAALLDELMADGFIK